MGGAGINLSFVLIAGLCLAAALVLFIVALRGRIVGRGSFCRTCRFDLAGRRSAGAPDPGGAPERCSECGSDLSRPGAVRAVLRRRRPLMLVAACLLFLASVGGVGGLLASRRPNFVTMLPSWYLAADASSVQDPGAARAITELTNRLRNGELSNPRVQGLIVRSLAFQADPAATWLPEWGDFIVAAGIRGALTPEQADAFVRHAVKFRARARDAARSGEPLTVLIAAGAGRAGTSASGVAFECRTLGASIGDAQLLRGSTSFSGTVSVGGESTSSTSIGLDAPVGDIVLKFSISAKAAASPTGLQAAQAWTEEFELPIKVLAPGTPLVKVITDPGQRPGVVQAVSIERAEAYPATGPGVADPQFFATTYINCQNPPVDLAYDILWKYTGADGQEHAGNFGSIVLPAHTTSNWGVSSQTIPGPPPDGPVQITLRPSLSLAERHTSITSMWDGTLVFKNVPVRNPRSQGAVGPPTRNAIRASEPQEPEPAPQQPGVPR